MYPLFELRRLFCIKNDDTVFHVASQNGELRQNNIKTLIRLCAWASTESISYLALVLTNNTIVFYRLGSHLNGKPVLRQLPWYGHPSKRIAALCFDPSGSWLLVATKDATLYVIPAIKFVNPSATLQPTWPVGDLTEIKLPGRRAAPTSVCWWQASSIQPVAIVGNELGEICFVDLLSRAEVGGTYVTVGILNMQLIFDMANSCKYLLITACNDVQWQLILEQKTTGFHWPLEKHDNGTSKKAAHKDRQNTNPAKDNDVRPKRLTHYAGHTHLQAQHSRKGTCISGKYAEKAVLTIHSPDLNVVPISIHKLPPFTAGQVLFADELLFVVADKRKPDQEGFHIFVIFSELATTSIDGKQAYPCDATAQCFALGADETSVALAYCQSSGVFQGPVVVTNHSVYFLQSRLTAAEMFQHIVMEEQNFEKADRFGRAMKLGVGMLYEKAADLKLAQAQIPTAVRLYKLAKCPHVRNVANFAICGYLPELLGYVRMLLAMANSEFSHGEMKHFSNMALYCHLQQILEAKASGLSSRNTFQEFLIENQHYDEELAIQLLASFGEYESLWEMAESRGLMIDALNEFLPRNAGVLVPHKASNQLRPKHWIDSDGVDIFQQKGYGTLLSLETNEAFLKGLLYPDLGLCFGISSDLLKSHLLLIKPLLLSWQNNPEHYEKLAQIYDPMQPAMALIYAGNPSNRPLTDIYENSGSGLDHFLGTPPKERDVARMLTETYLQTLVLLNKSQSQEVKFDLQLVTPKHKVHGNESIMQLEQSAPEARKMVRSSAAQVSCGFAHVAIVVSGRVCTWGRSTHGCLGTGPARTYSKHWETVPLPEPPALRVTSVACGAAHTLALTDLGLYAWGSNQYGQLGLGDGIGTVRKKSRPVLVTALTEMDVVSLSCGQYHSLALMADGAVYSWGWGVHGQLGHSNPNGSSVPRRIDSLLDFPVKHVSAGHGHSLFLTLEGTVFMCGNGTFGQLGHGETSKSNRPIQMDFKGETIRLANAGYFHNVAVSENGLGYTWGCNPQVLRLRAQALRKSRPATSQTSDSESDIPCVEELPTNSIYDPKHPNGIFTPGQIDMSNVDGRVTQIACGANHTVIVTETGQAYSWGRNLDGQLGAEGRKEKVEPVPIMAFEANSVAYASCGADFTILTDDVGRLWGFGVDDFLQVSGGIPNGGAHPSGMAQPSPSKIMTLRTTKRIIQIKSPTRSSIYKPRALDGVLRVALGETSSTRKRKRLTKLEDPPWSSAFLHSALQVLHGNYNVMVMLEFCEQLEQWQAAAKVALLGGQLLTSLEISLKALEVEASSEQALAEKVLALVEIIVSHLHCSPDFLASLLESIILFWQRHRLSMDIFETFLMKHMPIFITPLANALLGSNPMMDSNSVHFTSLMSSRFCLAIVHTLCEKLESGCLSDLGAALLGLPDDGISRTDERSAKLRHNAIDMTTEEVQKLVQNVKNQEIPQVMAFTCGHHYLSSSFRATVLPQFEDVLTELAPKSAKALKAIYAAPSFQPLACPNCVTKWLIGVTLPPLQLSLPEL